jgi:hypothetical protein
MPHLISKLAGGALLSVAVFSSTQACSLALPPIIKFNPNEYVFTGRVVGLLGPFQSKRLRDNAWGLQIEPMDAVNLPDRPTRYFEVIPFELWADCSLGGTDKEKLVKYYPVGSKVKVIARKAKLLPNPTAPGDVRLEISPYVWGDISRNSYDDGTQMADSKSVFDYKAYKMVTPDQYVSDFMPFLDARGALPDFELRKDLLRLETNKSRGDRITILERLMYYPICCGGLSYYGVTEHYLDKKTARAFSDRREAWIDKMNSAQN